MATAATLVDMGTGDSGRDKWGGVKIEIFNMTDTAVIATDTFTLTTQIKSVAALIGIPDTWTWAQSGETVTITAVAPSMAVNREFLVVGKAVL